MQSSLNTLECKRHKTQRSRGLHTGLETLCSVQIFGTAQTVSQVLKDQFVQASCFLNFYMGISRRVSALSSQFGNTQYNHRPFFRCHARALTGNTPWSFERFSHSNFCSRKEWYFPNFSAVVAAKTITDLMSHRKGSLILPRKRRKRNFLW